MGLPLTPCRSPGLRHYWEHPILTSHSTGEGMLGELGRDASELSYNLVNAY
jgi:hypothetical protein